MAKYSAAFLVMVCFILNLAMGVNQANADPTSTFEVKSANAGIITRKQAGIWVPIVFAAISVAAVYALFAIDDKKNRDTILYAKFLANLKDR